jgi:hypothetical protein
MTTSSEKLEHLSTDDEKLGVMFVESYPVTFGVDCDVYKFNDDETRDLAVVNVVGGQKTPLQRVLLAGMTIEGFISGKGTLRVTAPDGAEHVFDFEEGGSNEPVVVDTGDVMQWTAADQGLVFYEICQPPYQDGRFENLPEPKE